MIKVGIIGLNEGNGHPYSFSAIFNGYDEKALVELCPFPIIKKYLPLHHRNRTFIREASITHIWTQDKEISRNVARVAKIPNIVSEYRQLMGKVDAVILARDDVSNHLVMAKPFIEAGLPIYIDKLLTDNLSDLAKLREIAGEDYPLMAGSSAGYHPSVEKAKRELNMANVRTVHGVSRSTWLRYASHLIDGICSIFGTGVESVQNLGRNGFDIVHLHYQKGLEVVLQVITDLSLPIQFTCYSNDREGHYTVNFTDLPSYRNYFFSFVTMLKTFVEMVRTGRQPIPFTELVKINQIIIAGEMSKKEHNRKIFLKELES